MATPKLATRDADRPQCSMMNCWQPARAIKGGLCAACYQWWRHTQLYSATEMEAYSRRLQRFAGRATRLTGKPVFVAPAEVATTQATKRGLRVVHRGRGHGNRRHAA